MDWKRGVTRFYLVVWIGWALLLGSAMLTGPVRPWRLWIGLGVIGPAVLLGVLRWVWSGFERPPQSKR